MVIEDKIEKTFIQTETVYIRRERNSLINKSSDTFLDTILYFQKSFVGLTKKYQDLIDDLESFISDDKEERVLTVRELLVSLLSSSNKLLAKFVKSQFYSGLKTAIKEYRQEVNNIKEIIQDIDLKYKTLPKNKKIQDVVDKINNS